MLFRIYPRERMLYARLAGHWLVGRVCIGGKGRMSGNWLTSRVKLLHYTACKCCGGFDDCDCCYGLCDGHCEKWATGDRA